MKFDYQAIVLVDDEKDIVNLLQILKGNGYDVNVQVYLFKLKKKYYVFSSDLLLSSIFSIFFSFLPKNLLKILQNMLLYLQKRIFKFHNYFYFFWLEPLNVTTMSKLSTKLKKGTINSYKFLSGIVVLNVILFC